METESEDTGARAEFEYDRISVERFRETFPRARWDEDRKAWWVPGKTAEHRIARWRALEQSRADVHADAKGRDAYLFDPISSKYLEVGPELVVRTPYSRTVVAELRQVPFARWDDVRRAWVVPFRGYDELAKRWPDIEAAAGRNEPDVKKRRAEEARGTPEFEASRRRATERRKFRLPVPVNDPPPIGRPISTTPWGIIVVTGSTGEIAEAEAVRSFYPDVDVSGDVIWVIWRAATLDELVDTWPAKASPTAKELSRGWWQPTKADLVEARKAARSRNRRKVDDELQNSPADP